VDLDPEATAAIRNFIATFRYRVLVVGAGAEQRAALADILGETYRLQFADAVDPDAAHEGAAALVLYRSADLPSLAPALPESPTPMRVVYCGADAADDVLQAVNQGVVHYFLRTPLHPIGARTVFGRAVEAFALLLENERLAGELSRAVERLNLENQYLRSEVARHGGHETIVGTSTAIQRLRDLIDRVAPLQTTVHIAGETGVGKELVARALHAASTRSSAPFVTLDCSSLSESLLESELFGHAAGSFTGALADRAGLFAEAHGGTVFLDEIGNIPSSVQAKLLRVLEERQLRPVGSAKPIDVDIRLISASNRDLREEVRLGRFRSDLFYRLVVFSIDVPPLRARRVDVPALAQHFLQAYNARHATAVRGFEAGAIRALEDYGWPGNVRELQNEIERAAVLCGGSGRISTAMLSDRLRAGAVRRPGHARHGLRRSVAEFEREMIRDALDRSRGVVATAAVELGMDRTTLAKKCARLGIGPRRGHGPA
jgi:DNA-binding NtrC family response regulator